MNARNVKNAPSGGNQTRANNTKNQSYCITIQEDCKALKSFLEQEHVIEIIWNKYVDNYQRGQTEEIEKANEHFDEISKQIKDRDLFYEIDDAKADCCASYEYKGFCNGVLYALDFIFGEKTDEN